MLKVIKMFGLVQYATRFAVGNKKRFLKLLRLDNTQQKVNISSKALRELNGVSRPAPYDYRNKTYELRHSWFDKTSKRFDDNTKVCITN